jgi:hypothetical protein
MHFEENQLSRGLISLSLRPTAHPRIFQHSPVRSSTTFYCSFNLAMGRSPPFRVQHMQLIDALFGLGFPTPASRKELSSLHILTRRLIKQKARNHWNKFQLLHLVGTWFQVLFHSPHRGTFHLSLTVLVHYRSLVSI